MIFLPHTSTILEQQGKFLMVKEGKTNHYGKWNLPGGRLEPGERFCDGACREVLEETGLTIHLSKLVGIYTSWKHKHYLHYVYSGEVDGGQLSPQQGEILDCQWFHLQEIKGMDESLLVNPIKLNGILHEYLDGRGVGIQFIHEDA